MTASCERPQSTVEGNFFSTTSPRRHEIISMAVQDSAIMWLGVIYQGFANNCHAVAVKIVARCLFNSFESIRALLRIYKTLQKQRNLVQEQTNQICCQYSITALQHWFRFCPYHVNCNLNPIFRLLLIMILQADAKHTRQGYDLSITLSFETWHCLPCTNFVLLFNHLNIYHILKTGTLCI